MGKRVRRPATVDWNSVLKELPVSFTIDECGENKIASLCASSFSEVGEPRQNKKGYTRKVPEGCVSGSIVRL